MKAIVWQGVNKVGVENVPDPTLLLPTDAIVKITSTAICGSDLHLINGLIPTVREGDVLGELSLLDAGARFSAHVWLMSCRMPTVV